MLMFNRFYCKIRQFWWEKFINLLKDKNRTWQNFWWKKYIRLVIQFKTIQFNVIQIPSFCIVSLLCYRGHFSNITLTDAATKYTEVIISFSDVLGTYFCGVGSIHLDITWSHLRTLFSIGIPAYKIINNFKVE